MMRVWGHEFGEAGMVLMRWFAQQEEQARQRIMAASEHVFLPGLAGTREFYEYIGVEIHIPCPGTVEVIGATERQRELISRHTPVTICHRFVDSWDAWEAERRGRMERLEERLRLALRRENETRRGAAYQAALMLGSCAASRAARRRHRLLRRERYRRKHRV